MSSTQPVFQSDLDRASRGPLLFLFCSGALWLVIATALALVASIQMHSPGFLSGIGWLTYGRIQPVASNALIYGFAIQAGLGVLFWIISRLSHVPLKGANFIYVGGCFWNLALVIGFFAILSGAMTGYPWLEMPPALAVLMFIAYTMIAAAGLATFSARRQGELFASQWFALVAIIWFPWIFVAAELVLFNLPIRGVIQAVINLWYEQNLVYVWTSLVSLAVIFYFLAKLTGRELQNRTYATVVFWLLVIFGCWGGIHAGAPVPKWIPSLSIVGTVALIIPLAVYLLMLRQTLPCGAPAAVRSDVVFQFILFAAVAFAVATAIQIVGALRGVSRVVEFTIYDLGSRYAQLYGLLMMSLCGAIYYIVPRMMGRAWPSRRLMQAHLAVAVVGVLTSVAGLIVGGFFHGMAINSPDVPFVDVARLTIPFVGLNTLGMLCLLIGSGLFCVNLGWLLAGNCAECCCGWIRRPKTESESAKVTV